MIKRLFHIPLVALALLAAPFDASALFRSYLASDGNDANDCSLPTPCRLFSKALTTTDPGGEIWMLDSANFNNAPVVIDKNLSILAVPGAIGSLIASSGNAVVINAAGIKVFIKNVRVINGSGSNNGITFSQGASLTIVDSEFLGLPFVGVNISSAGSKTQIMRSTFKDNGAGLQVSNGVVNSLNNDFIGNATAVKAIGAGGSNVFPANGPVRVRVGGGTIQDNTIAFNMVDSGTRQSGSCNGSNIFLFNINSGLLTGLGNATWVTSSGTNDFNSGCAGPPVQYTIDNWNSPML